MTNGGIGGFPSGASGAVGDGSISAAKLAAPMGWGKIQSGYTFVFSPTATGNSTLTTGVLRLGPAFIPNPITLLAIGAEVQSAGEAGSKYRLGIYADNGSCYPGRLVLDAGTIAGDSNTVQDIAINQALAPGLYWFGGVTQVVTVTQPTMRITNAPPSTGPWLSMGSTAPSAGGTIAGYQQTGVTGALPAVFTSTLTLSTAAARVHVKVA